MPLHEPGRMAADISDPGAALALWSTLAPLGGANSGSAPASIDSPYRAQQPVRATFVAALDGQVTVDGKSAGLGTDMDSTVFQAMRARAGLVLVGAATARSEDYGPASVHPSLTHLRSQPNPPEIWMLTRTLRAEDIEHVAGAQAATPEASASRGAMRIVTSEDGASPELRERAATARVAVSIVPGSGKEFLSGAIAMARRESEGEINVEGGPRILASLFAEDLLDELVLSESPFLGSGSGARLLPDAGEGDPTWRRRLRVLTAFSSADGGLYTRWLVEKGEASAH